jgi:predicted nuclease of predicted toxin-antitoxin system
VKILLDECLPIDFRHSFPTHEAHTVEWAGLKGKKNGELLDAAELADYDVLLTMDQGVEHQQNLTNRRMALLVFVARSNQLEDLRPLVPEAVAMLESMEPGTIVRVAGPNRK